jgi:hypothetical protein
LCTIIENWRDCLDSNKKLVAVFLDLSKAFDTINHQILLHKLKLYNFSPDAIALIGDYLTDRFNIVKIDDYQSDKKRLVTGVPQGSILGPLLFLIFVNDFCFLDLFSDIFLFADDSTISYSHSNIDTLIKSMELDLEKIADWLHHNNLILNLKKTNAMHIKSSNHIRVDPLSLRLNCNNVSIPFVEQVTLLGVIIDCHLKFDLHTIQLCKKINSKLAIFKRCSYLFDISFKAILFKMFIQSRLEYCSTLFIHFSNNNDFLRLIKCFHRSIQSLLNIKLFGLSLFYQLNLLKPFNILPIQLRLFFHFNSFLFSILSFNNNSRLVKYIYNFKQKNNYNLRSQFIIPKINHQIKRFSFSVISIKILNS